MKWKVERTRNKGPMPRAYFAMFRHEHYLGVFGGSIEQSRSIGDFWMLDLLTLDWKVAYFTEVPQARHFTNFTDATHARKLMFGGYSMPDNILYNDCFEFNLDNFFFDPQYKDVIISRIRAGGGFRFYTGCRVF